jgi:hypothetical protein
MVVTTQIFFAMVRSKYHVHDIDTIIAVALTKHEYSIFKKLGKLIAENVPHNSSFCCYCYQRKSAKAKST